MLKFLRTIIKALSPDRSVPPKSYVEPEPLIPTRFAELFAKEDVWLVAFEPDKAKIPDGCNFILWFESDHSQEELLKVFEKGSPRSTSPSHRPRDRCRPKRRRCGRGSVD